jgi:thiamine biosynthesis protein ThiS
MTETLRITVNGQAREAAPGWSVERLVRELGLDPRLIVVERNLDILDRGLLPETKVQEGDTYELVHFVGGG